MEVEKKSAGNSHNTCMTCKAQWFLGMVTSNCPECGGFTLQRPCPVCSGTCGRIWKRNESMSHQMKAAHWDGTCGHPIEIQLAYFLRDTHPSNDELSVAMGDLSTG